MLAATVRRAFAESITEKPGPVHIELAEDVASELTSKRIFEKLTLRRPIAEQKAIARAVDLLMAARTSCCDCGSSRQSSTCHFRLRAFVDETGIYWCSTQMGKGVLDERQKGFLGCTALLTMTFVHGALEHE